MMTEHLPWACGSLRLVFPNEAHLGMLVVECWQLLKAHACFAYLSRSLAGHRVLSKTSTEIFGPCQKVLDHVPFITT